MGILGNIGGLTGFGKKPSTNSNNKPKEFKVLSLAEKLRERKRAQFDKLGQNAFKRKVIGDRKWSGHRKELIDYAKNMGTKREYVKDISKNVTKDKGKTFTENFMDAMAERHYNKNKPKFVESPKSKPSRGFTVFNKKPEKKAPVDRSQRKLSEGGPNIGLDKDKYGRISTKEKDLGARQSSVGEIGGAVQTANPNHPEESAFAVSKGVSGKASAVAGPEGKTSSIGAVPVKFEKKESDNDHPSTHVDLAA